MNEIKLKQILKQLKQENQSEWKKYWKSIYRIYKEHANRIINGEDPRDWTSKNYEIKGIRRYECIDIKKLFRYRFGGEFYAPNMDDENLKEFVKFLKKVKKLLLRKKYVNYLTNMYELKI